MRRREQIRFFIILFTISIIIAASLWTFLGVLDLKDKEDVKNIAVEFHGLIYDLIFFGILLTAYELSRQKRERLNDLKDQLNDFRFWHENEAKFRIRGIIKRLNKMDFYNIDLDSCDLSEMKLDYITIINGDMQNLNLSDASLIGANIKTDRVLGLNLSNAKLWNAKLEKMHFGGVNLEGTDLYKADLKNTTFHDNIFINTNLYQTQFDNSSFRGVKSFHRAIVHSLNWFEELRNSNVIGVDEVEEYHFIDPTPRRFSHNHLYLRNKECYLIFNRFELKKEKEREKRLQCNALTKTKNRCKNLCEIGETFCYIHRNILTSLKLKNETRHNNVHVDHSWQTPATPHARNVVEHKKMENKEWLKNIDWELERQVIIFVSDEAPEGLFELPSEFSRYELTFPQRMDLTYSILRELLNEELVILEEYSTREVRNPARVIEKEKTKDILDNHYHWYPVGQPIYSIGTTEKGIEYLNNLSADKKKKLNDRLFGKK